MFTGIVQAVGRIVRANPLEIDSGSLDLAGVAVGDSICVQGVCLTVTAIRGQGIHGGRVGGNPARHRRP